MPAAFRQALRTWLAAHHPGPEPDDEDAAFQFRRDWQRVLHDAGWLGLTWPEQYGGRGLDPHHLAVFAEELAASGAPRPANLIGLEMCGPTLISHGTEQQKAGLLPALLSGDEIWCQGFSEPDSGSDLASLRTRADRDGDVWRISGQKIWTSFAHESRRCLLLARTDPDTVAHAGITCFVLDMRQSAVDTRRIPQITGDAEFNEIFLDGAVATNEDVVGEIGDGWRVATTTLMHERANLAVALAVDVRVALNRLVEMARSGSVRFDSTQADRLAHLASEVDALGSTAARTLQQAAVGGAPGPESSLEKWRWAEVNQGINDLALSALGLEPDARWNKSYLRSRANTIEGGTAEILQNVVAQRVLHLPRGN